MTQRLTKPGLFITATDTEVGKTVATCAIAHSLRKQGYAVGVCKPFATGCRHDREGLVNEDAEALAHFADLRLPLHVINPIRYHAPLAPAVAAESETGEGDASLLDLSLRQIDQACDCTLIEGVGGILVPLPDGSTVLDFMQQLDYPVIVVTRPTLGTLNHTAMTCRLIRQAGLRLAGLVLNRYHVDAPDNTEVTNARWLAKQNKTTVLATLPDSQDVQPGKGRIPPAILEAAAMQDWRKLCRTPRGRV